MTGLPAAALRWRQARRILAVRLDNLGDVLMTSPALAAVKRAAPDIELCLLASPVGALAGRHLPVVDEVISYRAPWVKGGGQGSEEGADACNDDQALIAALAARRFDAAIIFTVSTQSALPAALLCRLAGIPLRLAHSRENPYGLLSDWQPETDSVCIDGMRHEVQRQLDLVAAVGFAPQGERLLFSWPASQVLSMRCKFVAAGGDLRRPYLLVHPGASAASRRYPAERFGSAAAAIARASGHQVVFCGDAAEQPLVALAQQALAEAGDEGKGSVGSIALVGQLALGELAALIAGAALLVCNNSAPAHIAAAVGTPVVVLYALTNPQHTPWRVPARVLNKPVPCRNCLQSRCPRPQHDCLRGVPAEQVAVAALELMQQAQRRVEVLSP
jgi:lipopolysaccharide heptosyltransferase II